MTVDKTQIADPGTKLSGKILLADDNETNLILGAMIIESLGVEVATAHNGTEAVAAALNDHYDLVLMDIHMPDFDGLEATRRIREMKATEVLPIVALTALAYEKEKERCIGGGMNGYLTKPIVRQELMNELSKWLRSSNPLLAGKNSMNSVSDSYLDVDLFDSDVFEELKRQIGVDNMETVLAKVAAEASQRWTDLVAADACDDEAGVQRNVHSLSSIFRSVGLMQVGDKLASIEGKLRTGEKVEDGWLESLAIIKTESLKALERTLAKY